MTAATAALDAHINVAGLLRRLADALPAMGGYTEDESAVLRRLADEQQQKEEYDAWVRAEVEAALADPRPRVPHEVARERMRQYMRQREREREQARGREHAATAV